MVNISRRSRISWLCLCSILCLLGQPSAIAQEDAAEEPTTLEQIAAQFANASRNQVPMLVTRMEEEVGEPSLPIMQALLDGDLYVRDEDGRLVIATELESRDYALTDILTGEALPDAGRRDVSRVPSNNSLRASIRQSMARMSLFSENPDLRRQSVRELFGRLDEESAGLLGEVRATEENSGIVELIDSALNLYNLQSPDADVRLTSAIALRGRLESEVRNGLNSLLRQDAEGNYLEPSDAVRVAAADSLEASRDRIKFYGFVETLFFGLSLGSVFLLVAAGLAITFGVMGVINMAHGELIMLGAYTTFVVQQLMPNNIAQSILVAIPAAFIVSGLVGVAIERGIIQFLKGRPLETLLATFGLSLILQQAVRSIFSPLNRQIVAPDWLSGSLQLNPVLSVTYNRIYILIFALLVFAALQLVMKKTSLGLQVRAVSQNRAMAKAMGVKTEWVDAMTFGLGSGIAGLAGVALSLITNVGPNLGQSYIINSFMVVVFGGVGNLWGTLVGGFSLGIASKFMEPVTGAVLANILVLVFIILFIQKRPKGLFPQKGRAAE